MVPDTKIGEVGKKIPDTSGLVTTSVLNTKTKEVDKKNTRFKWFSDGFCS